MPSDYYFIITFVARRIHIISNKTIEKEELYIFTIYI